MHIGLIGGLDRGVQHYQGVAARGGHTVECHTGHLAGRGVETLAAIIERSDLVVVITDVNSHGGMWSARKLAKARGRRCVLMRRMGSSRFRALLDELGEGEDPHCHAQCA